MRFVLANRLLTAAGGTEVHLVTIGEQLQRLGHEVVLYAPELGPFAEHAQRRGLDVFGAVRELPETCDVAFSQDSIVVYDLAERYPDALSVFRICGDVADFQLPPQLDGVVDVTIVLSDRYERIANASAVRTPVVRLKVPIDIDRLVPPGDIRERPQRAVMLGNYTEREALVTGVWSRRGVQVERVGGSVQTYDVARAVADADIVVAKARAALDAMACGRAVYVFDTFGGDGWVTPELYPQLEADMFAGLATGRVIDSETLAADLDGYRQEMGVVNRDLVLQHHSARDHVIAMLSALGHHVPQERSSAPLRELSRLTATQASWEQTAREYRLMHWPLREHAAKTERLAGESIEASHSAARQRDDAVASNERLEALLAAQTDAKAAAEREADRERADAAELRAQIEAMRSTRVWKLATWWWRLKRVLARSRRG